MMAIERREDRGGGEVLLPRQPCSSMPVPPGRETRRLSSRSEEEGEEEEEEEEAGTHAKNRDEGRER
jgi:hypothetical protein